MKVPHNMQFNTIKHWLCATVLAMLITNVHAETQVKFETSQGDFTVVLYPERAPKTVANFLQYVEDGFYEKTIFHRVIRGFMAQGGGFERDLQQKPTREPVANESGNGLLNETGTIAMARTNDPNSATAQFFINLKNNRFLDAPEGQAGKAGYCVFGKVTSGMDVIKQIGVTPTGYVGRFGDVPLKPITIKSVTLLSKVADK